MTVYAAGVAFLTVAVALLLPFVLLWCVEVVFCIPAYLASVTLERYCAAVVLLFLLGVRIGGGK